MFLAIGASKIVMVRATRSMYFEGMPLCCWINDTSHTHLNNKLAGKIKMGTHIPHVEILTAQKTLTQRNG